MFVIIGWVVAMGCIFGAYIVHGGNMGVIIHALPTEMMAILGGAIGAFVVNNQPKVLKATLGGLGGVFKGSKYTKARYMELLALLYDILQKARKEGLMSIEKDVEEPHSSALFQKYANVGNDHHVVEFVTDYLRMMVSGNLNAHEIESLMDSEIDTHHAEEHAAVAAIGRLAEPVQGLRRTLRHAVAVLATDAEVELGVDLAEFRGLSERLGRHLVEATFDILVLDEVQVRAAEHHAAPARARHHRQPHPVDHRPVSLHPDRVGALTDADNELLNARHGRGD